MTTPAPAYVYVIDSPATIPGQVWHLEIFARAADACGHAGHHTAHAPIVNGRGTSNVPAAAGLESGRIDRVGYGTCAVRRVEVKASRWQ